MAFEKIIDGILAVEKGFVDHPADRGGPTNYGITQATARANGYAGDMRNLPIEFARQVYENRYIIEPGFNQVASFSYPIAEELIDTGVNMGPGVAAQLLQRSLNSFNLDNRLGHDLVVDGRLGPQSIAVLGRFLAWRGTQGEKVMLRVLNSLQAVRYMDIADNDPSQRAFMFGWIANRVA